MSDPLENSDFTLLVAAAGHGERLGLGPKAFLRLGDKTLLEWVVEIGSRCVQRIAVVVPAGTIDQARQALKAYPQVKILEGGATRQASYRILLETCETPYVLVRDVARPLASEALLREVASAARVHGAAGAFNTFVTPIGIGQDQYVTGVLPRAQALVPSNPQAYTTAVLAQAVIAAFERGVEPQTLWELMLLENRTMYVVAGEETNHKITTARDWAIMQQVTFPQWLAEHGNEQGGATHAQK